jgi:predicted nucleic acid-binding protein
MIVIADTSPLNYLIRLGHPEVLRDIYGRVLVPNPEYQGQFLGSQTQHPTMIFCIAATIESSKEKPK